MTRQNPETIRSVLSLIQHLTSAGDFTSKESAAVDIIARMIQADWVSLVVFNPADQKFREITQNGHHHAPSLSPVNAASILNPAFILSENFPEINELIRSSDRFRNLYPTAEIDPEGCRGISEALAIHGKFYGVISAARRKDRCRFDHDQQSLLSAIALLISQTIYAEDLVHTGKTHQEQAATLREVAQNLNSSLDMQTVLELILDQLDRVIPYDSASIMLVDGQELHIVAHRKLRHPEQLIVSGMTFDYTHIVEVLDQHDPVIINNTEIDPRWHDLPGTDYIRSWLGVPLIRINETIGLLNLDKEQPDGFTQEDAELATTFANQAAVAIDNARLYLSARQAAERREILHRVSQQIVVAGLDEEGIYQAIHLAAAELMPVEAFIITEYDETAQTIRDCYLIDRTGRISPTIFRPDQSLSSKVIRSGQSIYIPELKADPERGQYLHFGDEQQVHSILAAPMRLRGRVIGMISAQSYTTDAYTQEDLSLLEMLASYAAIALENAHLFAHIQQLATTDPVTGISNRRHLFDQGQQEFSRARRFNRALSVIMMDIDHFKWINDRFGHAKGDDVLHHLAQVIHSEIRDVDLIGRYGGEEFTIILPETDLRSAVEVAKRLRHRINEITPDNDLEFAPITVSIGIAANRPEVSDFTSLVELADQALYKAKEAGRDRIEMYDPQNSGPMARSE